MRERTWRPGDPLPPPNASRSRHTHGYVRLHWTADGVAYAAYEHRVIAGAGLGEHVHHINGIKDDNRPENLEIMVPAEHHRHHNVLPEHNARTDVTNEAIRELYDRGLSARAIARALGCASPTIDNRLRKLGLAPRRQGRPNVTGSSEVCPECGGYKERYARRCRRCWKPRNQYTGPEHHHSLKHGVPQWSGGDAA